MRKQFIVSGWEGNIVPTLIIIVVAVFFYFDGLKVYFFGVYWEDLYWVEKIRSNFYFHSDNIRPVSFATKDLIRFIFGLGNPLPLHAILLGLHIANSVLVFFILQKVIGRQAGRQAGRPSWRLTIY